jgi:hypothetical protein
MATVNTPLVTNLGMDDAATGQPVSASQTLSVLGHLSIIGFIVAGGFVWWWEHQRVVAWAVCPAGHSFRRSHVIVPASQVTSYLGLVPQEHRSGEKQCRSRVLRSAHPYLQSLLVQESGEVFQTMPGNAPFPAEFMLRRAAVEPLRRTGGREKNVVAAGRLRV